MSSCIKKTKMRGQGSKPRISKKLNLDDVCGLQNDSFKNKRTFQNHYRTHGEELFTCTECPANWSEGPENMFNTKRSSYWRRVVGTESEGEGLSGLWCTPMLITFEI